MSQDDLPERIVADPEGVAVAPRLRAMLDYALALTRSPSRSGPEDIARLREVALTDDEIHRVAMVVAYFNYVNRIAEGLGVELET